MWRCACGLCVLLCVFVMGKQESMTHGLLIRCVSVWEGVKAKMLALPPHHAPPPPEMIKQGCDCCVCISMKRDACHHCFINQGVGLFELYL